LAIADCPIADCRLPIADLPVVRLPIGDLPVVRLPIGDFAGCLIADW
jgi:hypothetical protein